MALSRISAPHPHSNPGIPTPSCLFPLLGGWSKGTWYHQGLGTSKSPNRIIYSELRNYIHYNRISRKRRAKRGDRGTFFQQDMTEWENT